MGLPENIDALLVKFDINADQLARVAGVDKSSVTRWRQGAQMRKSTLAKVCDFFDLTEDDLLSTENGLAAKEHGHAPGISLSEDEREMLMIFRNLDSAKKTALLAVARAM